MRSIPMPRLLKVLLLLCGVGLLFSSLNVYNVQKIETISPHNGPVETQKLLLGELKVNIKRVNTASKPTVAAKPFVQSEVKYTLLHGYIDDFSEDKSHGWACFPTIDQPVTIKIVDDTTQSVVGEVLANRERVDLATAGVCTGSFHGWIFYFEDAWMRGRHNLAFYAKYEHEGNSLTKLMGVKNVTILAPPSNLTAITSKSGINSQVEWENTANAYDFSENGLVTKVSRTNKNQIVYDHEADSVNFMLVRERNGVNTGLWSSTMETFPKVYNSEQSFFPQFHNSMESKLNNKKVLIWTHNLHLEGAPICAYQLAVYLKQRSVDIVVQAGGNGTLYTYLQANGIDVIFGFSVKSPEKYSLVILNTVTASKVLELQPALWPKAVWWVHEQEPALFKHYNMDLLEEVAMAVFPTKGCLDTYKDWNRGHFVVVPNGVDLSRRDRIQASNTREGFRKSLGIKPDEFVVTLHGTFAPNKGQLALLEVANKLKDQNVKFLLVGATESLQDYQKQMMDYINTNKLSKVLLFYKNPFVDLFYGSTDLHISNTQLTESFGLTLIEAMSFGVPVVAPDLQGMSAIVQHNKTGYLFPPQNADELAKWIMFMKNRPTASAAMGQVAKAYVESTYSLDIVMSKFEEALSLVISTFNKS